MFRKTGTKSLSRAPNKLFEAAAENAAKNLVGSLVQSKFDPISRLLDIETEAEFTTGMVVKIQPPTRDKKWTFELLIEEKVQKFSYENFSDFYDNWTVVNRAKI